MSRRIRIAMSTAALAGLAALLFWAFIGLPDFGHYRGPYGRMLNGSALSERHTTNVVAATVFDYRGLDTLGEEFILFTAVLGVVLLLRSSGKEEGDKDEPDEVVDSDSVTMVGILLVGLTVLIGLWLVAFGYITPGGGFQGGVVLASGAILVWVARSHGAFSKLTPEVLLDPVEAVGAGGYAAVGIAALLAGLPFLHNLFGAGETGSLLSGGSIPLLNWASAIEVAAANVILCKEFLDEYVIPLARGEQ